MFYDVKWIITIRTRRKTRLLESSPSWIVSRMLWSPTLVRHLCMYTICMLTPSTEKVLERGEKIELLVDRTDRLNQQAFRFERRSKQLKRSVQWKNIKTKICLGLIGLLALYWIVSMFCGYDMSSCASHHDPKY